jgi:hypothetical protein
MTYEKKFTDAEVRPIFDGVVYGRLLRAARIIAGFDTVKDCLAHIHERTGLALSERTLYAIERGEQTPTVEQYFAFAIACQPPGGLAYWESAFNDQVRGEFSRRIQGGR